jgi:hypothetical protein
MSLHVRPIMENVCADCGEPLEKDGALYIVEAFETFDEELCDGCFENRCEAAWERQQEDLMSGPPISLAEQHSRAWHQHQELHRR